MGADCAARLVLVAEVLSSTATARLVRAACRRDSMVCSLEKSSGGMLLFFTLNCGLRARDLYVISALTDAGKRLNLIWSVLRSTRGHRQTLLLEPTRSCSFKRATTWGAGARLRWARLSAIGKRQCRSRSPSPAGPFQTTKPACVHRRTTNGVKPAVYPLFFLGLQPSSGCG